MVNAYVNRYIGDDWTDAAIALLQGGGVRADSDAGNVTVMSLTTILPFENTLVVINMTGFEILEALEHSVAR